MIDANGRSHRSAHHDGLAERRSQSSGSVSRRSPRLSLEPGAPGPTRGSRTSHGLAPRYESCLRGCSAIDAERCCASRVGCARSCPSRSEALASPADLAVAARRRTDLAQHRLRSPAERSTAVEQLFAPGSMAARAGIISRRADRLRRPRLSRRPRRARRQSHGYTSRRRHRRWTRRRTLHPRACALGEQRKRRRRRRAAREIALGALERWLDARRGVEMIDLNVAAAARAGVRRSVESPRRSLARRATAARDSPLSSTPRAPLRRRHSPKAPSASSTPSSPRSFPTRRGSAPSPPSAIERASSRAPTTRPDPPHILAVLLLEPPPVDAGPGALRFSRVASSAPGPSIHDPRQCNTPPSATPASPFHASASAA